MRGRHRRDGCYAARHLQRCGGVCVRERRDKIAATADRRRGDAIAQRASQYLAGVAWRLADIGISVLPRSAAASASRTLGGAAEKNNIGGVDGGATTSKMGSEQRQTRARLGGRRHKRHQAGGAGAGVHRRRQNGNIDGATPAACRKTRRGDRHDRDRAYAYFRVRGAYFAALRRALGLTVSLTSAATYCLQLLPALLQHLRRQR